MASHNSIGMTMVPLSQGEFEMGMLDEHRLKLEHKGSAYQREIHDYVERPSFPVRLPRDFSIGETEVTVSQFRVFVEATGYQTDAEKTGEAWGFRPNAEDPLNRFSLIQGANWRNPGFEQSDKHPVTCISWHDAQAFCRWLSEQEGVTYRLPTEAEWEYACRAGTRSSYFSGDKPDSVYEVGNVADASLYALHPEDVLRQRTVGLELATGDGFVFTAPAKSFRANAWGIYDTHGNVWEWCHDKYSDRYYDDMLTQARQNGSRTKPEPIVNPQGPEDTPKHQHGDWRSLRGGSWYVAPLQCRSSVRAFAEAHDAFSYIGFRVVRQEK
ncbi:formylglycine-generating enzyme family protein [Bremerella alba]|uniref:formylglycine-generating enzyme family protein n=1 Tax=Bremerella alba TaxID=980252 RepID=UPI0028F44688|nr:formylglycine-generating enzyme family protein [Bremerella alba]